MMHQYWSGCNAVLWASRASSCPLSHPCSPLVYALLLQVGKRLLRIDDIVTHRDQVVEVIFEHVRGLDTSAQGASGDWPVCRASLFVATGPYTPVQIYFRFLLAGKDQPQHAPLQDVASRCEPDKSGQGFLTDHAFADGALQSFTAACAQVG